MSEPLHAVLLMAYGTPDTLDDVGAYFTHIRGGRVPSAESIADLRRRYECVGGSTPLLAITRAVREHLAVALAAGGTPRLVFVGMKHWHPYIAETVQRMAEQGVERVTAVALAPHYSRMSVGAYRKAVEEANEALGSPLDIHFVDRWHDRPEFVDLWAGLVKAGLEKFPAADRRFVVPLFTAHSLPVRIRTWNDPYEGELLDSATRVADRLELKDWRFAWQSAGGSSEPWLGPDVLEYLERLSDQGARSVLQIPIGFVADHLEVLYDIDVEAKARAAELGIQLERTALPNADPAFISTLAAVVRAADRSWAADSAIGEAAARA